VKMTIEQWRARRAAQESFTPEGMDTVEGPVIVYPGGLYINGPEDYHGEDVYTLTIANCEYVGGLEFLERQLYAWADSEGYLE
jgi:hypothetical protein